MDQHIVDFLIELFRHGSHPFVAKLAEERGWSIVFEGGGTLVVLVEHDPERRIETRRQPVPRHLSRDQHIADHILRRLALPRDDLQPVSMRRDRENDEMGVALDGLQLASDAIDLAILQKIANAIVELRKCLQRRPYVVIAPDGVDTYVFDRNSLPLDNRPADSC